MVLQPNEVAFLAALEAAFPPPITEADSIARVALASKLTVPAAGQIIEVELTLGELFFLTKAVRTSRVFMMRTEGEARWRLRRRLNHALNLLIVPSKTE